MCVCARACVWVWVWVRVCVCDPGEGVPFSLAGINVRTRVGDPELGGDLPRAIRSASAERAAESSRISCLCSNFCGLFRCCA